MLGAKPAAAPASWRYNTVAGGFFAACAYIQVNDPDPLVRLLGYFVGGTCWSVASLLFPLGHVKSTKSDDEEFVRAFTASPKWLAMRQE